MPKYAITFKHNQETILVECDWYELFNGFVNLWIGPDRHKAPENIASYLADNVLCIVLQKEYTQEEILRDMMSI